MSGPDGIFSFDDEDFFPSTDPFAPETIEATIAERMAPGMPGDDATKLVRGLIAAYSLPAEAEAGVERTYVALRGRGMLAPGAPEMDAPTLRLPTVRPIPGNAPSPRRARPPDTLLRAVAAVLVVAVLGGSFYLLLRQHSPGGRPSSTPTQASTSGPVTPTLSPTQTTTSAPVTPTPTLPTTIGAWHDASITAANTNGVPLNFDPAAGVSYAVSEISGTIYACSSSHLWYSDDGGQTYTPFQPDLPPQLATPAGQSCLISTVPGAPGVFASVYHPGAGQGTAIAGTPTSAGQDGPIMYATPGAAAWQTLRVPQSVSAPNNAAQTWPMDPDRVWKDVFNDEFPAYGQIPRMVGHWFFADSGPPSSGAYLVGTPDFGATWVRLDAPLGNALDCGQIAADPDNANHIFCLFGATDTVWQTNDGGASWQALSGQVTQLWVSGQAAYGYGQNGIVRQAFTGGSWQPLTFATPLDPNGGGHVLDASPGDAVYFEHSLQGSSDQVQIFVCLPGTTQFKSVAPQETLPEPGVGMAFDLGGIWPGGQPALYAHYVPDPQRATSLPIYRLALPGS